jgi:WD40 repeat protein
MADKLRIFISYSHNDSACAHRLFASLQEAGHRVAIDTEGLFDAEHITPRLQEMIRASDVVLMVLTQSWLNSFPCAEEMRFAIRHNKRIVPAAFENVADVLPPEIKDIIYVRFYGELTYDESFERLDLALSRDIDWLRDHTQYGEMASRWITGNGMVLRGRELRAMRQWISNQPPTAPDPTEVHQGFLRAGLRRASHDKIITGVIGLTLVIAMGVIGIFADRNVTQQECQTLRELTRNTLLMQPVDAILHILPAASMVRCRDHDTWLNITTVVANAQREQRLRAIVTVAKDPIEFVDFLGDRIHMVIGSIDGDAEIFNLLTGELVDQTFAPPEQSSPTMLEFHDGLVLVIEDQKLTIWDPIAEIRIGVPLIMDAPITSAVLSPDHSMLAIATANRLIHTYRVDSGDMVYSPLAMETDITDMAFRSQEQELIVAIGAQILIVDIDPTNLDEPADWTVIPFVDDITALAVSDDGRQIAVGSGNLIGLWDAQTFEPLVTPKPFDRISVVINTMTFSDDGHRLLVGFSNKRARVYNGWNGRLQLDLSDHFGGVTSANFSGDGRYVVTLDETGMARVFDVATGQEAYWTDRPEVHDVIAASEASANTFASTISSPSGEYVLNQAEGNLLVLSQVGETTSSIFNSQMRHGERPISSIAFSADERLIVTAADDGQIRVWDARTGVLIYRFDHSQDGFATALAADFSADGFHVISWRENDDVRIWNVNFPDGDMIQAACRRLPFQDGARLFSSRLIEEGAEASNSMPDPCESIAMMLR